jgi:parvulin-like peptidyl-prolyl isomerase
VRKTHAHENAGSVLLMQGLQDESLITLLLVLKGLTSMITQIRKSFKSNGFKIALWFILLALSAGMLFQTQLFQWGSRASWAARVNGKELGYNELIRKAAMHQEFVSNLRAQYGDYADVWLKSLGMNLDPKESAMQELLQEELLNQAAKKIGIQVGPEYISEKLSNPLFVQQELGGLIPAGVMDQYGGINMQILKNYLNRMGLSVSDFEDNVAQAVTRNMMGQLIKLGAYTPEFAIKDYYNVKNIRKKFEILVIPLSALIAQEKSHKVSEDELKDFFNRESAQNQRYWIPEKRSATVWSMEPEEEGGAVSSQEIESYYNDHKASKYVESPAKVKVRRILIAVNGEAERPGAMEKARRIQDQLRKSPNSFAELAQESSDDAQTAKKGGIMDEFSRGEKDREFEKAAFVLKSKGDLSDVITTPQGYELLQLESKTPAQYKSFESVREEIATALISQKFNMRFAKEIQNLFEQTKGDAAAFEKALEDKGAQKTTIKDIAADDPKWGKQIFAIRNVGEINSYAQDNVGKVLQLTKIQDKTLPTLESVQDAVEKDFYEIRAKKAMKNKLSELKKLAQSSASLKEVQAAVPGSKIETTDWIAPSDNQSVMALHKKGIPVNALMQLNKPGNVAIAYEGNDGYILRLEEAEIMAENDFQSKKAAVARELEAQEMKLYLAGFVASLYRSAKIEKNESSGPINEDYVHYED